MNVVDTKKVSYNVEKKLGEGSQGVTYLLEDKRHIAKLFTKNFDSSMSKSKINFLINLNLDKKIFAIPLRAIAQPSNGYIAEFASGMIPLSEMKLNPKIKSLSQWYKETGGLIRRYKLLIHLSSILRTIHSKGLTYCDLSPNNIFISENIKYHNVFLIDLDNLRYKTSLLNNIFTPFYGAPELVNNTAPNTPMSDSFSFAVISYEILTLNHPLIGDYVSEGEPEFEEKALAGKLPWVEHSTDSVNYRSTGFPSDKVIPRKLMELFNKTFEVGLNRAMKRPSMAEWFDALNLALNELLKCSNKECGLYYPYNNYNSCTFCGHKPKVVTRIQMRRWEEIESYNKKTNQIESKFMLEPTIYEEILIDENTEKDVAAFNFLIGNKEPLQSILNIQHINEKSENKLLLTPLNSMVYYVSPRTGISDGGKSIKLDTPKKIRVIDKRLSDKQKYMLHIENLNTPQRVLTID